MSILQSGREQAQPGKYNSFHFHYDMLSCSKNDKRQGQTKQLNVYGLGQWSIRPKWHI